MKVHFGKLDFLQRNHVLNRIYSTTSQADVVDSSAYLNEIAIDINARVSKILPDSPAEMHSIERIKTILAMDITRSHYTIPGSFIRNHDYLFLPTPNFKSEDADRLRRSLEGRDVVIFREMLTTLSTKLQSLLKDGSTWNENTIHHAIEAEFPAKEERVILHKALRYALAGGRSGPSIAQVMVVLGEDMALERMREVDFSGQRLVDGMGRTHESYNIDATSRT